MIFRFEPYELDTRTQELRRQGTPVPVEPQVFSLLAHLIAHRDKVVSKDELLAAVWAGRIVSDAAIDSRVRSARQAVGDDGQRQDMLRTIRGRGFRFVAEVAVVAGRTPDDSTGDTPGDGAGTPPATAPAALSLQSLSPHPSTTDPSPRSEQGPDATPQPADQAGGRPTIAVLPFAAIGEEGRFGNVALALPHDLIAALSRLRWLFVIARGSSFRFQGGQAGPLDAARRLGVRYCLAGAVELFGSRVEVTTELLDTSRGGIIWAERYGADIADIYDLRARIAASVVAAMELRIPMLEAERAALRSPENLDAWGAYHLGLRHMYRFTAGDNQKAMGFFTQAVQADPGFARAHAGLSFAHFQEAFVLFSADPGAAKRLARACAEKALELDPLDPFANYTMGRADWLDGELDGAAAWLERCIDLNPNHAQGVYASAYIDTMSGRLDGVGARIDTARALSPYDPLRYAMLSTRAVALASAGALEDAVAWADRSAREPNAHALIDLIAAAVNEMAGRHDAAMAWMTSARAKNARFRQADFFQSMPFRNPETRRALGQAFDRLGLP